MNKLSKEKKSQLILVILLTALAVVGMWFGLIKFQRDGLSSLANSKATAENHLNDVQTTIASANRLKVELAEVSQELTEKENGMVSGDPHSWMFEMISQFKMPYRVDIPQFSTILVGETTMFPKFPYKQVSMTIGGTAYYHDLGRFIADFENHFPYMRVQNLDIEPAQAALTNDREKLQFRMEIVALVKPGTS